MLQYLNWCFQTWFCSNIFRTIIFHWSPLIFWLGGSTSNQKPIAQWRKSWWITLPLFIGSMKCFLRICLICQRFSTTTPSLSSAWHVEPKNHDVDGKNHGFLLKIIPKIIQLNVSTQSRCRGTRKSCVTEALCWSPTQWGPGVENRLEVYYIYI